MTEPVRVLHINAGNLYGGVETYISTLAERRDLEPGMIPEFALCFGGRQEDELRASGCPVHRLSEVRFSKPWTVWKARRALANLLTPFDVIVCHQPWGQALFGAVAVKHHKGYVAYFHGPCGHDWLERRARRTNPHLVIAPSAHSLGTVRDSFSHATQAVINYPLPGRLLSRKELNPEERQQLRRQLGANESDVLILQASRVESWKGPDLVVKAFSQLKNMPGWRFVFAGAPQRPHEEMLYTEMKALARDGGIEDRVQFLGNRTDVPLLMQAADLYTQGNRGAEGFSLSFLEASYSSLPIVTTDIGGASEMIDESNGILTPPLDVNALAAALRKLIQDSALRLAMGRRGREKALTLSDTATQMKKLAVLLNDVKGRLQ